LLQQYDFSRRKCATSPQIYGIFDYSSVSSNDNFYHNSINIFGGTTVSNNHSYAFFRGIGNIIKVKDNIFYNKRLGATGYYQIGVYNSTPSGWSADRNDLWASTLGYCSTGAYTVLANWIMATSQDANSKNVAPLYVSDSNLHLQATSPVISQGGTTILIPADYDGDPRSVPVDIGADDYIIKSIILSQEKTLTSDLAFIPILSPK